MRTDAPLAAIIAGMSLWSGFVSPARAQSPDPAVHTTHATGAGSMSATEAATLQRELLQVQSHLRALEQRMQSRPGSMQKGGSRAQSGSMPQTRVTDDMDMPMNSGSSSMSSSSTRGMSMMEMMRSMMSNEVGMGAMGGMSSSAAMATPSALPGFTGQSHLYHIGATGFFLNHPQHITLTMHQEQMLAKHKQQALIHYGELQRQMDAAEVRLWQLTGADQPQIVSVEKQVREIERLRAEQRIAFIRAVGEAATVLNDEQRQQLTGLAPAPSTAAASMPHSSQHKPNPDNPGHM